MEEGELTVAEVKKEGAWRDFLALTPLQQGQACAARPNWLRKECQRFQFWVRPNGSVSRRNGLHRLTAAEYAKIDAMLEEARHG